LDKIPYRRSRHRTLLARYFSSVDEQRHRRNAGNAKSCSQTGQLFGVNFRDDKPACAFFGYGCNLRRHHAAWSTPRRPEIHQHGQIGIAGQGIKGSFGWQIGWRCGRWKLPMTFAAAKCAAKPAVGHPVALAAVLTGDH
jgi:hypothetical protein